MKGIIAVNRLGYIGLNGTLPWKSADDLNHFKIMTMGCSLLVGSVTAKKLPFLPGRNITIYQRGLWIDPTKIDWCIGGKTMYEMFMHQFEEFHISVIYDYTVGDVKMPDISKLPSGCRIFEYRFKVNSQ